MTIPERIGRFTVLRLLGEGGFAQVVLAEDPQLGGNVAIKVLKIRAEDDPELHDRFLAEARRLRQAESDRVVRVYDIGELPDGRPYLVMEYANAGTLEDRLAPKTEPTPTLLDPAVTFRYGAEIARAVHALHQVNVAHRDIKPSNVLFHSTPSAGERLLLADLGVSKDLSDTRGYTRGAGTAGYMAPEQGVGVAITERVDIYGVGAVVYRMLTGQVPPPGAPPVPPSRLRHDLPAATDRVLLRALATAPKDRQESAEQLAQQLDYLAEEVAAGPSSHTRRWALLGAAGLVAACVAVGVALYATQSPTDGSRAHQAKGSNPSPSASSSSSSPATGEVIPHRKVVRLSSVTGIGMRSPDDGRLRNVQTAVAVTSIGTGESVTDKDVTYRAGKGATLHVFRLRQEYRAPESGSGSDVTTYLTVDGERRDVPGFGSLKVGSQAYYAVSARSTVTLTLEHSALTQTFDLTRRRRVGSQPAVLYRFDGRASWYSSNVGSGTTGLTGGDGAEGTYKINGDAAGLTYHIRETTPRSNDRGLFWITTKHSLDGDVSSCAVPLAAYRLKAGGQTYAPDSKQSRTGPRSAWLLFDVPADVRDAALEVDLDEARCRTSSGATGLDAEGPARIALTVPAH